ncbi:MAG: DUF2169 domain-containing protein [Myxococcota bacterium]
MELQNHTPWPHLMFERADPDDRRFKVLVFQGTFRFADEGGPLLPLERQPPVVPVDEYLGDPSATGLGRAGAVATFKLRADVSVLAFARSPEPKTEWTTSLRVGALHHALRVRGLHHWYRHEGSWRRSDPEACTEVPLVYERAFGGRFETAEDGWVSEPRNPLGTGYLPPKVDHPESVYAPQITAVDEPEHEPGKRYAPRGWAPIPGYFAPRSEYLGTVDAAWKRDRWPRLPADFSNDFYQSAHPDLVYPGHLRGDEAIEIEGVTADGRARTGRLPGFLVFGLLRLHSGRMMVQTALLDTLHLDLRSANPNLHRAILTWRLVMPNAAGIRKVEGRMVPLEDAAAASS